jgi:hypothetical protein
MWPTTFDARLAAWNLLREQAANCPPEQALELVNSWWFRTPWTPYHLHWDDQAYWPDPWQMLSENIYCSLARGLGIMYTIALLDRDDISDALLCECESDNLVLVSDRKYILNWDKGTIVNINPGTLHPRRRVDLRSIQHKIR